MSVLLVLIAVAAVGLGTVGGWLAAQSKSRLGQVAGALIVLVAFLAFIAALATLGSDTGGD
jgi:hypothetical protein